MMARDGGHGTSRRHPSPLLAARGDETGGEGIAHGKGTLDRMWREPVFCLSSEGPVYPRLKPSVRNRRAKAGSNRPPRRASASVLVVLPAPGAFLPTDGEFAHIVQSARDLHQLLNPDFWNAIPDRQKLRSPRVRCAHGARLVGDPF